MCTFHRESSGLLATTVISGCQVPSAHYAQHSMFSRVDLRVFCARHHDCPHLTAGVLWPSDVRRLAQLTDLGRQKANFRSQDFSPAEPKLLRAWVLVAFGIYSKSSHTLALKRSVLRVTDHVVLWHSGKWSSWNGTLAPLLSRWVQFLKRDSKDDYY